MSSENGSRSYELEWRFNSRILTEHFGRHKYAKTPTAVGELVANALAAGARHIAVGIVLNDLDVVERVTITDDGSGMPPSALQERFVEVGVPTNAHHEGSPFQLGRFGVGRLAVHRIGARSDWTTVAEAPDGRHIRSHFTLRYGDNANLQVAEDTVDSSVPCGTQIDVSAIFDTSAEAFAPGRLASDLLAQFCSYLLGNLGCEIRVQGELLDVGGLIAQREVETLPATSLVPDETRLQHLLLNHPVEATRFPAHLLFSAGGRTIATAEVEEVPSPRYVGLAECRYLDTLVTSSREGLADMDEGFRELRSRALASVKTYARKLAADRRHLFIETARQEDYYPFRGAPTDAVTQVKQVLYDISLEKLNEHVNVSTMTKRQQAMVFRLLHRAIENEDLLVILGEVARLSDDEMDQFRRALEYMTLGSIIKLSFEVSSRLGFLDVLHDLVYGDISKQLKERSQLHKILEPQCWLFGPRFHLAASDKSFREVVRRHRQLAGLDPVPDDTVAAIAGVEQVPDLFLAAAREYPVEPKHHHLLVEIKAPHVPLGRKQAEQIRRYAEVVLSSHEFEKVSTRWDIYLVSARPSDEIQRDRTQKGKPYGCLYEWDEATLWAFTWSEIITNARDELRLVREHLERTTKGLSMSDYLRENFPDMLAALLPEAAAAS